MKIDDFYTQGSDWQYRVETITPAIVKEAFFSNVLGDILRAIEGKSLMGAFILSICSLDYLAHCQLKMTATDKEIRTKKQRTVFQDFVDECDGLRHNNSITKEQLWGIRCSLMHVYGESERSKNIVCPIFTHNQCHLHLQKLNSLNDELGIWLNLEDLVADIILVADQFFGIWNKNDKQLEDWYKESIHLYESSAPHPILKDFTNNILADRQVLAASIANLYG